MKITKKIVLLTGLFILCSLIVFYVYSAVLTGGNLTIPVIATPSGGGVTTTGGNFTLSAPAIGQSVAGVGIAGGNLTIAGGITPAIVTLETAKKDLSTAHCYPVPFKPSIGHTKITFKDLTRDAEIKIYTISGELVITLIKSDTNDYLEWDVKNSRGEAISSGVYIYRIKSVNSSKKGKLMIIK